jgi:DNA-binding ferritin-like protein
MEKLATILRSLQLYSHQAHNLIRGQTFFQDHEFLGEIYPAYETDYDDVVERCIGTGEKIDIKAVNKQAAENLPSDSLLTVDFCFARLLTNEKLLCKQIEEVTPKVSIGTQQLIGEIANKSEVRQYKLKQRTAKEQT